MDKGKERAVLEQVARRLEVMLGDDLSVRGSARGHLISFSFVRRGSENPMPWTEITVETPPEYALKLTLRARREDDARRGRREGMLDLFVGDAAFTERFRVEAAPRDIVLHVLDQDAREQLLALGDVELGSDHTDSNGMSERRELKLGVSRWIGDPVLAVRLVDFLVGLAERLHEAYTHVPLSENADSPYRPDQDADAQLALENQRERELADLEVVQVVQPKRGPFESALLAIALVLMAAGLVVMTVVLVLGVIRLVL